MTRQHIAGSVAASLLVLLAGKPAVAQTLGETRVVPTPELTSVTLPGGRTEIRLPIAINVSKGQGGKPISIPLEVYHGINDDLTIGLTHSGGVVQSTSPYQPGSGLCLTGTSNGCPKVYNNFGFDLLWRFLGPTLQLAAHGGLDFDSLDPDLQLSLRLGLLFQAPLGSNVALILDPRLSFGLTSRDSGNKEFLSLPAAVQFWVTPGVRLAVRTVLAGQLDGFGDAFTGSLGIFGGFAINETVELFASFDFLNLYGTAGSADARGLVLGANFRL
jgi:hypothetical protein